MSPSRLASLPVHRFGCQPAGENLLEGGRIYGLDQVLVETRLLAQPPVLLLAIPRHCYKEQRVATGSLSQCAGAIA